MDVSMALENLSGLPQSVSISVLITHIVIRIGNKTIGQQLNDKNVLKNFNTELLPYKNLRRQLLPKAQRQNSYQKHIYNHNCIYC